jgi:hypothetical protein
MSDKTHVEHAELCLRTIEDNVNMAMSVIRASHFNHDADLEHHRKVVLARMKEVRSFAMNWAMVADAKAKEAA